MPNTRSRGIPVIEPDPELDRTLRRMNQNLGIQGDEVDPQMPPLVKAHEPVLPYIRGEGEIRRQPASPRPQKYCRGYENIAHSDGPLCLPPQPHDHSFVVTRNLMQMLTA